VAVGTKVWKQPKSIAKDDVVEYAKDVGLVARDDDVDTQEDVHVEMMKKEEASL